MFYTVELLTKRGESGGGVLWSQDLIAEAAGGVVRVGLHRGQRPGASIVMRWFIPLPDYDCEEEKREGV